MKSIRSVGVAVVFGLVCACTFTLERQLDRGDIRGTLRVMLADGSTQAVVNAWVRLDGSNFAVQSDLSGRFILREVPDGAYRLRVLHEQIMGEETVVSSVTQDIELAAGEAVDLGVLLLAELGELEGVVYRGGEPVSATVAIDGEAVSPSEFEQGYRLSGLAPGARVLSVRAMGPNGPRLYVGPTVEIAPRVSTVADVHLEDFAPAPAASLSVRVRLSDGGDPSGVDIELHDGESVLRLPETDAQGFVSDVEVPAGLYTLVAKKAGYLPSRLTAFVVSGKARAPDLVLTPEACRTTPQSAGCGDVSMRDRDGDGIPDHLDHCPDDPLDRCAPGVPPVPDAPRYCGSGLQDRDGDGVCRPDCSAVVCKLRQTCDDSSGTASCVCKPGHQGELCVPSNAGASLVFTTRPQKAKAGEPLAPVAVVFADAHGNAVTDAQAPVTLTLEGGTGGALGGTTSTTAQMGEATFSSLVIEKAATGYRLVATSAGFARATSEPFEIVPTEVDAGASQMTFDIKRAIADGNDAITITARALDRFGNAVWGAPVAMRSSRGEDVFAPSSGEADVRGRFVSRLKTTSPGERTIEADIAGHRYKGDVAFAPPAEDGAKTTLAASEQALVVGESATLTVTVRASDDKGIADRVVALSSDGGLVEFTPVEGRTGANGVFTASFSARTAHDALVYATVGNQTLEAAVSFVPGAPSPTNSSVHLDRDRLATDGESEAVVGVTVVDEFFNAISGASVVISTTGPTVDVTQPEPTDAQGVTRGSIKGREPGTVTVKVKAEDIELDLDATLRLLPGRKVGGVVRGLTAAGLVLANGNDTVAVEEDGPFEFERLYYEGVYEVTVAQQPEGQGCVVVRGRGTIEHMEDIDIEVECGSRWGKVGSGPTANHTFGIAQDGGLWAWGRNDHGQLGDGTTIERRTRVRILENASFTTFAAGETHSFAIDDAKKLWAWGDNAQGQLGNGSTAPSLSPQLIAPDTRFEQISTGASHALALDSDGNVWAWGGNDEGQLGDGTLEQRLSPVKLPIPSPSSTRVVAVAAGALHSLALDEEGVVWAWGRNANGELGVESATNRRTPVRVVFANADGNPVSVTFKAISAGEAHSFAVATDGSLWGWGDNEEGQLGMQAAGASPLAPTELLIWGNRAKVASIAAGGRHSLIVQEDASMWAWGRHEEGATGSDGFQARTPIRLGDGQTWSAVSAGAQHSVALAGGGTLWAWGDNVSGQLGNGVPHERTSPVLVMSEQAFVTISAGLSHSLALDEAGGLWGWGPNVSGAFATDEGLRRLVPERVLPHMTFTDVVTSDYHTLARDTEGRLWGWGNNVFGVFGNGTTAPSTGPVEAASGETFAKVSTAGGNVLAIDEGGAIWSWGANQNGELGNGSSKRSLWPVEASFQLKAVAVSAGYNHCLAIDEYGAIWAWGRGDEGQLGNGSSATPSLVPVRVEHPKAFQSVVAGYGYSLALDVDGKLWGWGENSRGQLGLGGTDAASTPTAILPSKTFTTMTAKSEHVLAVDTDGTLWAWGNNASGQLGNGTTTSTLSPVSVPGVALESVSAGVSHSLGLDADGGLWAWGSTENGLLGTGETARYRTPIPIR